MKKEDKWQQKLTEEQYKVTRLKGTEQAFSGKYNEHKEEGIYNCVCCGAELFSSESKYDSGSGWPSFYQVKSKDNVNEHTDASNGMIRTEVVCSKCEAHLGHLFPDGPRPTGMRYCINSASLEFKKK